MKAFAVAIALLIASVCVLGWRVDVVERSLQRNWEATSDCRLVQVSHLSGPLEILESRASTESRSRILAPGAATESFGPAFFSPQEDRMLLLSRKRNERIEIGEDVSIVVVEIRGDKVRLGIQAPEHITVHRQEVADAIRREGPRS